ncbi:MAG: caspase family protein [Methylomonas sp.]|nr:caspase family protein [Methylomonas sp.]
MAGALDGYLRVYDASFKLAARVQIPDVKLIGATYFSNDNNHLLVGVYDSPSIRILSFPQLQVEQILSVPNEQTQTSLRNAIWSRSGEFIYALGDSNDTQEAHIFRWAINNPTNYEVINIATHRIQSMRPYGQHGLVFSTEDATIGIVDDTGKLARINDSRLVEFPQMSEALQISADAKTVTFPLNQTADQLVAFNIDDLSITFNTALPIKVDSQNIDSGKIGLTDWRNSQTPAINGVKLPLEPFEVSRSYAAAPNGKAIYLGTEWALRAYDKTGQLLWRSAMPGVVWNIKVSKDGRWVLATLSDGTVRWYRASDGKETMALFVDPKSHEWVLWRPDGYYASSENGDNLIGWHVNRGMDEAPDFYRAVQFERQFYRPDLLRAQLGTIGMSIQPDASRQTSTAESARKTRWATIGLVKSQTNTLAATSTVTLSQLNEIAPPRIRIVSIKSVKNDEGTEELELTVDAEKNSHPMLDVTVYSNLLPVAANKERILAASEADKFSRTFRFPINIGDNLIRVEVNNGVSLGLTEQWIESSSMQQETPPKGNLYVLSVGVDRFERISSNDKEKVPDLKYAANDAVKLSELLQNAAVESEFEQVHVQILSEGSYVKPSRQNILEALRLFEQAGPNDTVLLFLASHGFSDDTGNYYFLPKDGEYGDVESVLSGRNLTGKAPSLLSWTDFLDGMRKASGRRVMIVDTCQAKNVFGEFDSRSLRKRSAAALFPLLLASKGDELSQEYEPAQHGLFTHALLEGLRGMADVNHDRKITVTELHDFAVPLVEKLHNPSAGSQTPQMIAPGLLENIALPMSH